MELASCSKSSTVTTADASDKRQQQKTTPFTSTIVVADITQFRAEPKNIKEAMTDHAWIKAMQEEFHQLND
ncbi:hypothetical protein Tco_0610776 [Tanacetum coccineum]